ncbi:antibiotic biosynthesis monooxygenase [Kribbella swartbergensis]
MSLIAVTRFEAVDTAEATEIRDRHTALVQAVRAARPGLIEARLGRLDDGQWAGVWRWDSKDSLQAVRELAPNLPEVKAAFAVVREGSAAVDEIEVVDEL